MKRISERCASLRDDAVNHKSLNQKILAQHVILFESGVYAYLHSGGTGAHSKLAAGINNVIRNAAVVIQEGELLVGYNYADTPYPEFWSPEDTPEDLRLVQMAGFTKQQFDEHILHHEEVLHHYQYDRHVFDYNITHNPMVAYGQIPFLKDFTSQELELDDEWAAIGRCMSDNHTIVNYDIVLKLGFEGLKEKVEQFEAINGSCDMYDAMKTICEAACCLGERYADEAIRQAQTAPRQRRVELERIAEVCRRVPARPARSFYEAIQSLLFAHYINTWEDGINANSLGRLDQILMPYYRADLDFGRITPEEAFELICCLWIKLYRDYDVQQSCVGGCLEDGSNGVNDLSWMMLDATEALNFIRCLSVRFTPRTDPKFICRALEVVGHVQKGVPFFFNDDVLIPALCSEGIALEDARNYTQIGCVETVLPGMSNPHAVSGETNLLKAIEYVFGNGHSLFEPARKPGIATGELEQFHSYVDFKTAVFCQIEHIIDVSCRKVALWSDAAARLNPKPLKSLLTLDCVENGRDFNDHGARYDYYQIMLGGVPNLADSLMVVRKLVYEEEKYTLKDFLYQLQNDFPDEAFRQECLNRVEKFGNDIDAVDSIATEIVNWSCDVLARMNTRYGLRFHAQPFTYLWMVEHGNVSAASPDGRHRGETIAYSVSPMQGRDFNGFTALLNSLAKLPTRRCAGTASAIVEVDPKLFTDDNITTLADILLAAAEKGLANVQFNTVDANTLLDAQRHPELHNNLAVRVSGFSQKFNLLDRALQNHIIGRTKHECL